MVAGGRGSCLITSLLNWCRRVLIDTGEADRPDYLELLHSTLQQAKATICEILITHWHLDHTGGLPGVLGLMKGMYIHGHLSPVVKS